MKKITLTAFAIAVVLTSLMGQNIDKKKVPAAVISKFSSLYPTVSNETWKKEGKSFTADFNANNTATKVAIDGNASLLYEATEIKISDMPKLAGDYLAAYYASENLTQAQKIVYANNGKPSTHYNCETNTTILVFDRLGNFQGTRKK